MGKHEKKDPPTGDKHEPNHPPPPDSGRPGKHRKPDPFDSRLLQSASGMR